MRCPICGNSYFSDFLKYPAYKVCLSCNFYYQEVAPSKTFEGHEENEGKGPGAGHLMSDDEKTINKNLAHALYQMFLPSSVLDIGSKYPFFLSVLKDKVEVLGIEGVPQIIEYGKELDIPVINADFESMDIAPYKNKFDLITLIHTFEHFYNPLETMKRVLECLSHRGIVFIRIPNMDVKGIEKDFTDHHLTIHPYIYSTQALYILSEKLGCEIFRVDNIEGSGQSDFYIRKRKERFTLSVCMIVKNEEKNVTDCLESIKDIADEIIIVDTGSTDKTKEVVSKYTDKIFDFKWIDDFSVARNFSLGKATCDWILWCDADDIVENPKEILPLLKESSDAFNFNIKYGSDIFYQARLFRNYRNTLFVGRVHEYVILDNLVFKEKTDINVSHKTKKHSFENRIERNYRILKKEAEENPDDSRTLFYLGNALKELGRYDEATEIYQKYLKISSWRDEKWMAQRYIGNMLQWQKCYVEAIEEFKKAIEIDNRWAESYYYIGECYYLLDKYKECIEWMLKSAEKTIPLSSLWKELSAYREAPYRYIFASYDVLGDYQKALDYCKIASEKNPDDQWLKDRCIYFEDRLKGGLMIIECFRQGALGDCLMTTAALRGLKQKYPGCFIRYVTHSNSKQILEGNKYIDVISLESKDDSAKKIYFSYPDKGSPIKDEGYPDKPLTRHLIKIFNECAGLSDNDMRMECSLLREEEKVGEALKFQYKKYVTIHTKSGWSSYKDWYDDRWETMIEELFKKGYVTVQIGHETDLLLKSAVDFRGHTIKEAIAAIKYADIHIGVDSFTNHASSAVETPAVILFGSTSPTGSGYEQNINIYKSLSCQPCYREYKWSKDSKEPCPYNKKCMDLITVDEVLENIFKIFDRL